MINFFKKQNNKKGFSLVETLVALFVFSIAVTATMAVMSQGVSSITNSKNKITASFLAQEGIEYFRNIRDSYYLSFPEDKNTAWNDFAETLYGSCISDGCGLSLLENYTFSFTVNEFYFFIHNCDGNFCGFRYIPSSGIFIQQDTTGAVTIFTRKIKFEKLDDNNLKIISEVSYTQGGKTNAVSSTDYLTNWAE